ncbi:50S ribosomal protein L1 [Lactobacillus johnsonii]|uniref:Large ribosomal subunit protein uL1 n=1 Tax=Lactobacillus johnsonii (strain CNCM I-12250 / La1 / NCC 533) TaxID=257314 RepID=RL1_LACJO|nr:50S ribosomal protein L1 [Lactobacillus johnsonii]Q74L13.1 RecName: Full=Large ribosomal subunit protein uL1; AltName: Full=50S ribosomal protein L1 [Lactobacillus johnsonii NCC 533]AAS08402.1 50S ribosomal protein L1 [Lactobacillus johnsonii NCC 533]MCT3322121.1 50S ribosomal protein L1 [Lactobacillus johnsonii]MCT3339917.1 50S ribosomal protein L1 [Lactobacillus johnsonii]MCT3388574.1 50S ribosomal protein L1 [Lactobacillus johnsonii]
MAKHGKRYLEAAKKVDSTKFYSVDEAMKLAKETSYANFDATIEVAYNLNVDPKQADQQIRGALVLPNGTGKSKKVVVFAEGPQADQAKEAGADEVGSDDLVEKVQNGYLDFDVVIATPMMMAKVGRLGRILGPKGLMPNPKTGTVTMDVAKAVENQKAGQVEYRVDKQGLIHAPIGKASFDAEKLAQNFDALRDVILRARPASTKGQYVKSVAVSATFGPGIHLDPLNLD